MPLRKDPSDSDAYGCYSHFSLKHNEPLRRTYGITNAAGVQPAGPHSHPSSSPPGTDPQPRRPSDVPYDKVDAGQS